MQTSKHDQFEMWDVNTSKFQARLQFPEPVEGWYDRRISRDGRYAVFAGPGAAVYLFRLPGPPVAP